MNKLDHDVIEFVIKKQIKESIVTLLCQTVDKLILLIVFYFFNL